jgi:hypothetical protein
MEELISIPKYAAQKRLSIHNVIKKTMNGELKTVVQKEGEKEVTYILPTPEEKPLPASTATLPEEDLIDYKKEYEALHKEFLILKTKYEKLCQS